MMVTVDLGVHADAVRKWAVVHGYEDVGGHVHLAAAVRAMIAEVLLAVDEMTKGD